MLLDPAAGGGRSEHVYLSDFGLSKQAVAGRHVVLHRAAARVNPIGITMSGNGQWLYVTTQKRDPHADQGTLSVINVARAESHPG